MLQNIKVIVTIVLIIGNGLADKRIDDDGDDKYMHVHRVHDVLPNTRNAKAINPQEFESSYWRNQAQSYLANRLGLETKENTNLAKNIIMFLGDGMSLQTVAATRVYMGGEEVQLSFEKFPYFGLSKTYCVDRQVADSACTATAFLSGVKANYGTMGLNAGVKRYDCAGALNETTHTRSLAKWAQDACKATGLVTTSKITHATPAGVYAHIANRYWENNREVENDNCDSNIVDDIGEQLINSEVGKNLKVILGGGRGDLLDEEIIDDEGKIGYRSDGKNLIQEWLTNHRDSNAKYVWNNHDLKSIDISSTDYLMGLFEQDHCLYTLDIANQELSYQEPTLSEMTEIALKMLQKEENGYFLFVESARIDTAHHDNYARIALDETKEFSKTIQLIKSMTSEEDTLIIVTADHGHVMSYNGYSRRGTDILGLSDTKDDNGFAYPTLSYANGMGYYNTYRENGLLNDISQLSFTDPTLQYMATVPRETDTHGGDDVGVYAVGPWAHLFTGNYEQHVIPILMTYASKIGPYTEKEENFVCGTAMSNTITLSILISSIFVIIFYN